MTLDELQHTLPNGLHDAELAGINLDFPAGKAALTVNVDIGDSRADDRLRDGDMYRAARIEFAGVQFLVIDPPAIETPYSSVSMIDAGLGQPRTSPCVLPSIRKECFLCWIFVVRWNSFIRISAESVALEWIDDRQ
jgi:hypothetical protein